MAEYRNKLLEGTFPGKVTMNFEFRNPTHLIFAARGLSRLGEVVRSQGGRALLVTGGGSVRRSGAFDRAVESLKAASVSVAECFGVEPNPRLSSVLCDLGCPTRLSQLGIGKVMLPRYARDTVRIIHDEEGRLPGRPPMHEDQIVEVLRSAL